MNTPKTVKSFLTKCLEIANTDRGDLKGIEKLSQEEYSLLGCIRAGIQNDLGEEPLQTLMEKYNLKYEG